MKKIFAIMILVLINGSMVFAEDSGSVNLLKNGGFEKLNPKGTPSSWQVVFSRSFTGKTAKINVSTEQVKSGEKSIEMFCAGDNNAYFAIRQSINGFAINDKLEIKADVYIDDFNSGQIKLFYLTISYGDKIAYPALVTIKPDNCEIGTWKNYKQTLDLSKYPGVKSITLWILIDKECDGKIFVDNVSVIKQK